MRTRRTGVVSRGLASGRAEWHERVRRWDGLGFDLLLVSDHVGHWPPLVPLVAAADATERLRLGTQVLNTAFWNPALLARDAAAADLLTDGRIELGFGSGYARAEFDAVGIHYGSTASRIDHLAAALPAIRTLLAGGTVERDDALGMTACALGFRAGQDRVPFLVGGNGDRLLAVAAEHADTVQFIGLTSREGTVTPAVTHFTWSGLAERIAHVRAEAGDRADALELSVLLQEVVVTDHPATVDLPRLARLGIPADLAGDSPFCLVGPRSAMAEHLDRLASDLGVTAVTVLEEHAAAFADVWAGIRP